MKFFAHTALLAGLAAFGSAVGAPIPVRAATTDDACAIPLAVVSSAVGVPIVRTRPRPEISSCGYKSAGPFPSVSVTTYRDDTVAEATAGFTEKVKGLSIAAGGAPAAIIPVPGIGDQAAVVDGLLYARKGTATYVFTILDSVRGPATLPRAEKLAKLVLARVKG